MNILDCKTLPCQEVAALYYAQIFGNPTECSNGISSPGCERTFQPSQITEAGNPNQCAFQIRRARFHPSVAGFQLQFTNTSLTLDTVVTVYDPAGNVVFTGTVCADSTLDAYFLTATNSMLDVPACSISLSPAGSLLKVNGLVRGYALVNTLQTP